MTHPFQRHRALGPQGCSLVLAVALVTQALPASAIVFNASRFNLAEEGLPAPVLGPLRLERLPRIDGATVEDRLAQVSLAPPFLAVGRLRMDGGRRGCTATWLVERDGWTYLLTAAHCIRPRTAVEMPMNASFLGWDGTPLAGGWGSAFVLPRAVGDFQGVDDSVDIAVVKLPTQTAARGDDGQALTPPLLYDGRQEGAAPVDIVGYGLTGVADPSRGQRRQWGRMGSLDPSLPRSLTAWRNDGPDHWAETSRGDSGSAWWQRHDGDWSIVAVTCCGSREDDPEGHKEGNAVGARISSHVDWLIGLVPGALTLSNRISVTADRPFVSRDPEDRGQSGRVFFQIPQSDDTAGPTTPLWSGYLHASRVLTKVRDASTGERVTVALRAQRDIGCALKRQWAYAARCDGKTLGPLVVSFHAEDNPQLPPGDWLGRFEIEATRQFDESSKESFPVNVRLKR
jgi:V8-like Glu-specific endopeptidase